ncbi:MAG: NADH-quinone oxidoreductase subunit NuoI [Desulfobacterales bacterium]|jgi:NADH-quinone oxidoreductase subunit I
MSDERKRSEFEKPLGSEPEQNLWDGVKALGTGFFITFRHLFRRPITEQYPEEQRQLPERSRARIVLTVDPNGDERCVACYLCSAVCPVSCISMQSAQRSDGRRYAEWFRINFGRCIYCGLCEEACPTSAIQLTPNFDHCRRDILSLVFEKEDLLVDHCGKDKEYNFYRHAGVAPRAEEKGTHLKEKPPVDVKTNLP